jgi:hypothetical protein
VNQTLVTEVAKTTAATLMRLASSPSRLQGLAAVSQPDGTIAVTWTPSPERDVTHYIVAWGSPDEPLARRMHVQDPAARIQAPAGSIVSVRAVNRSGLEGWDWARVRTPAGSR